jgi:hypothetical protein
MRSACYFCPILTNIGICRQIFVKIPNVKFHVNPSIRSRTVPRGQTDGHHEAGVRFFATALRKSASNPSFQNSVN